jgi:histidinol phosphatase-like enzyme (inositol monophosphatase family)
VTDRERLLADAVAFAQAAGDATLAWFRRPDLVVDRKADGSEVTAADRASERSIREALATRYPHDAIIGEEEGSSPGSTGRTWVIDPIDGTTPFTCGVPLYATLLAVLEDDEPCVGVIHLPALALTVAAASGLGCFANGSRVKVRTRDRADLAGAMVMTSAVDSWTPAMLAALKEQRGKLRTWGDAYGYALVATGGVDAMVDPIANLWDLAPMPVVIGEAGGRFTDRAGRSTAAGGDGVGSVGGALHDALLDVVNAA